MTIKMKMTDIMMTTDKLSYDKPYKKVDKKESDRPSYHCR